MKMKFFLPLLLLFPCALWAQQPAAPAAYRIEVILHEMQAGKAGTVHTFVLNATPGTPAKVQAGDKIPIATGSGPGDIQFTYDPVGYIVSCTPSVSHDTPAGELRLSLHVEASAVVAASSGSVPKQPVFRFAVADVSTVVPLGKSTTVADFSDAAHQVRYQAEVLVTPLP